MPNVRIRADSVVVDTARDHRHSAGFCLSKCAEIGSPPSRDLLPCASHPVRCRPEGPRHSSQGQQRHAAGERRDDNARPRRLAEPLIAPIFQLSRRRRAALSPAEEPPPPPVRARPAAAKIRSSDEPFRDGGLRIQAYLRQVMQKRPDRLPVRRPVGLSTAPETVAFSERRRTPAEFHPSPVPRSRQDRRRRYLGGGLVYSMLVHGKSQRSCERGA